MKMRINKYLAVCGLGSRRRVENYINQRKVSINGKLARLYDYVHPEADTVMVDGKIVKPKSFEYYILNKPKGIVSTTKDEFGRKTVLDLVRSRSKQSLKIAGRLDINTTGLILLTDDSRLITKITSNKSNIPKTYKVLVAGDLSKVQIYRLQTGVDIGGYVTKPAKVSNIKRLSGKTQFEITLYEGKNHQIKRMCEKVNLSFLDLQRISIGGLKLGDLAVGKVKKLSSEYIAKVFAL